MKYLSDYTKDSYSEIFIKLGVFFAFSEQQYKENAVDGVEYVTSGGSFCPKQNVKAYQEAIKAATNRAIMLDKLDNGMYKIIRRELFNYECFYTYEIDEAIAAVEPYGYTQADVLEVFNKIRTTEDVD